MQTTELFVSDLIKALSKGNHNDISDFLPTAHESLPEIQENLLYICASGSQTIKKNSEYTFADLDGYMLLYTKGGQGYIEVSGDSCHIMPGDLLIWDCTDLIRMKAGAEGWDFSLMFINGNMMATYYDEICKIDFPRFKIEPESLYMCLIMELMSLGSAISPHHAILANKLLTDLLSGLVMSRYITKPDELVVPRYINEICKMFDNACNVDYSMEDLAKQFRVNRYRLTRDFSKYLGMPPVKYLNSVRMEHAKALLEATDMPVNVVAAAVGIHNPTHFINLYKEKTGMTPLVYRDNYRSFKSIREK